MFKEYDFAPKKTIERVLFLGLVTVLILFGTHSGIFSLAAFVICIPVIIFDKTHFKLMMMTYLMLLAHVFCISPEGMSYFTFLMLLYIGVKLVEERSVVWIAILFIVYVLAVQLIRSDIRINEDIKLAGNLLFIGYSLGEISTFSDKEKDILCMTFISSVLISSVLRFFDSDFFRISAFTNSLKAIGTGTENEIVRFSGLYQDPNYYTVNLIIALCLVAILYYRGSVSKVFCAVSVAALVYFGTLTYSKSFLLMLLIPVITFLAANHRIGRYDVQIISIVLIVAAVALILLINPDYLSGMQQRLEDGNSLTTGRSDIWLAYLDHIYHHPDILLFGSGIGAGFLYGHAPHNSYVDILYHLGLVGSFLLIVTIVNSGRAYRKHFRTNLLNRSVMISVLITYFFLSQLAGYEFPVHFMLAYMLINQMDLSRRQLPETPMICQPLLSAVNAEKITTLSPLEEKE